MPENTGEATLPAPANQSYGLALSMLMLNPIGSKEKTYSEISRLYLEDNI
jgi:hypothetical protein